MFGAGDLTTKAAIDQLAQQMATALNLDDEAQQQVAAELQKPLDSMQELPARLQSLQRAFENSLAMHQFRLPGTNQVVVDRREQPSHGKPDVAKDAAREMAQRHVDDKKGKESAKKEVRDRFRLRDGKLIKEMGTRESDRLSDRNISRGSLEREAASSRVDRMMNQFYKVLSARFNDGVQIARQSADGKLNLLEKTLAQWKSFFGNFSDRTVQKKVLLSEIREFLMRGLIPRGNKGVFIGDMQLISGRTEKFIRFSILADAFAKLKGMSPGDKFDAAILGELLSEELMFLALAASRGREFEASMLPAQGKFLGGRAESRAAEELGLPVAAHLRQKAKHLRGRRGGTLGKNWFGEEVPEEMPYRFVPWYQLGNLKSGGKLKWVTATFYGTLFILALVGILALTYRLIGGM